ncbi:MAG: hypothetical protein AAF713_14800 [Pseudomonadota bacterium]
MHDQAVTLSFSAHELRMLCGCLSRTKARFENMLETVNDPDRRASAERELMILETLKERLTSRL